MILRVKPTPARFPTNSLYTPVDNTLLHSISSVCYPWGVIVAPSFKFRQPFYPPSCFELEKNFGLLYKPHNEGFAQDGGTDSAC